jgi:hypothetical protein
VTHKQLEAKLYAEELARLEYHCRRLHPMVMQLDGEMADDGALVVRATTFTHWPPGSGDSRPGWEHPFGPVRVWGTLQHGVFVLHGWDAQAFEISPRPLKIRLGGQSRGRGRPPRPPDPGLIENILQWMQGRLRAGESVDDLREEDYVLYRWSDRYSAENEVLEGAHAFARAMLGGKRTKSVQSGTRYLRKQLTQLYPWHQLKQLACAKE